MLHKTEGLVLGFIRYGDSSIIVRIYTEAFGLQSYIVNGVRSAKAKTNRISLFQPLTLLHLVVYHHPRKNLQRISEVRCPNPFHSIPFDHKKSSIALFLTEVLSKTLKEESAQPGLFPFLKEFVLELDQRKEHYLNLHLQFLVHYAAHLGFMPGDAEDLQQTALEIFNEDELTALRNLLSSSYGDPLPLDNALRRKLLDVLLHYYSAHIESFGQVHALEILREVFQ